MRKGTGNAVERAHDLPPGVRVNHTPGIITITDANTTLGYCRYDDSGEIEYVFVSAPHRRRGYGRLLLRMVEERLGVALRFRRPFSPLGECLVRRCYNHPAADASQPAPRATPSLRLRRDPSERS